MADRIEEHMPIDELEGFIVDAGGDLVVGGCQSNGEPWSIGLENPFAPQKLAAAISLPTNQRTAVCTSSLWKKSWRYGTADVHHLIDPATGKPMETELMSVTVISPQAALSEALTKYIFVHGTTTRPGRNEFPLSAISIGKNKCIKSTAEVLPLLTWKSPDLEFILPRI